MGGGRAGGGAAELRQVDARREPGAPWGAPGAPGSWPRRLMQSPEKALKGVCGYMGQGDGEKAPLLGLWRAALGWWRQVQRSILPESLCRGVHLIGANKSATLRPDRLS